MYMIHKYIFHIFNYYYFYKIFFNRNIAAKTDKSNALYAVNHSLFRCNA